MCGLRYTLYNAILCITRNLLETRENIKISTHHFYPIILDWFSFLCFRMFELNPGCSVQESYKPVVLISDFLEVAWFHERNWHWILLIRAYLLHSNQLNDLNKTQNVTQKYTISINFVHCFEKLIVFSVSHIITGISLA